MPAPSSQTPERVALQRVLQRLLEARGDEIEFVVLFGSRARGNWSPGSDYDLLVGLRTDDGKRLTDRIYEFSPLAGTELDVELFPYDRSGWRRMFEGRNLLLLEALDHGEVLFDRCAFDEMRRTFRRWRAEGEVVPSGRGWRINPS